MNKYAIVLAGGTGSRMKSDIPKQYMEVCGKPLLLYALETFEKSDVIDGIVIVVARQDEEYCLKNIIDRYNINKFVKFAYAGKERYESVYNALLAIDEECERVFIHDGARPCVTVDMIKKLDEKSNKTGNAVAAVPSKDTVKIADDNGFCISTPDRKNVWIVQTPQVFSYQAIKNAYIKMMNCGQTENITDDAMVMEKFGSERICLYGGEYTNIKVTTTEDIEVLETFLKK